MSNPIIHFGRKLDFGFPRQVSLSMTSTHLNISDKCALMMVLVVALLSFGCNSSAPPTSTTDTIESPSKEVFNPFDVSIANDSIETETSELTFDEKIEKVMESIESMPIDEPPAPEPFDPPLTETDIQHVLQQCLEYLLTDAEVKNTREFYGTDESTEVVLVTDSAQNWPDGFKPKVQDWTIRFGESVSEGLDQDRVLGIQLDKLDVKAPHPGIFNGNIILTVTNAGGTKNGIVQGGCRTFFTIRRDGERYAAKFAGSLDP